MFGFSRKQPTRPVPVTTRRVVIEGAATTPIPTFTPLPPIDALESALLFKGLHEDHDPASRVRTAQMTCPACNTGFRYFLNSDGKKTIVRCPGCAKTYRA